ncbi:uncharacterized protein B0T15DRAFT_576440 [Chaetomium strumarium]|uniref:Uncharacterized protein n=1 Tax=Chaetomium strumarium TaxID=1170767 RepID=A0AAJ0LZ52_9PEZI|nr:hypothetical protein B0T15DRAFT_576440 [Chaetomium strumarium]
MDGSGPWVPDFDDNSPWRWPWWKFDMKPEDLFTTLTDRYNTVPYKTQNYEAFHQDVNEIAAKAEDVLDFHQRRALRREQRIQEMRRAWDNIGVNVLCNSSVFDDNAARLKAFLYFTSNLSLDALILFVDSLHPRPLRARRAIWLGASTWTLAHPIEVMRNNEDAVDSRKGNSSNRRGNGRISRPSPRATPSSPPVLTRHAGVSRKTTQRGGTARLGTSKAGQPDSDPRTSPDLRLQRKRHQQRPAKRRTSRRLAGRPPEFSEA